MDKKYTEIGEWDFTDSDTKEFTHCFHIYPAVMIPQIARKLIERYGVEGGYLFDPYCGTGTSLVEARIAGMNAIGTDLNPTARMISKAKIKDYNIEKLKKSVEKYMYQVEEGISEINDYSNFSCPDSIEWEDLEKWFPKKTIGEILFCLSIIEKLPYKSAQLFLKVALSECFRLVSYQRNGEFKLYRIKEEDRVDFYEPLFTKLKERINRNFLGVTNFSEKVDMSTKTKIKDFNTVVTSGRKYFQLPIGSLDLVVTSPPYGDSSTTVAYAQFSWLSNVLLGLDKNSPSTLDSDLMGGRNKLMKPLACYRILNYEPIKDAFENILEKDEKRALEVLQFYYDYYLSINNVASEIKKGGHACYVVGNRIVKNVKLPTDQFTAWAFRNQGFEYLETYVRKIPNKRMPSKNSPTNQSGITNSTMTEEYIVVCRKN